MTAWGQLCALVLATTAVVASTGTTDRATPDRASSCPPAGVSVAYGRSVDRALRAGRDVWGAALLRAPGGPTYEAARRYLHPLLYARGPQGARLTASGVHYLPFAQPRGPGGATAVALHVADGSQILSNRVAGDDLRVSVGTRGWEPYGSCLARLATPRLVRGYLPILDTRYTDAEGVRYRQESFATRDPKSSLLVSYLRVVADARRATRDTELRLTPSSGEPVHHRVAAGGSLTAYVSWSASAGPVAVDQASYEAARASIVDYWTRRLSEGARISVPEKRVEDAARATTIQNLVLGWRYSVGNPYQQLSYPEGIDVAETMAALGHGAVAKAILLESLEQPVTRYPSWKMGQKLVGSALYYRLYRDRAYVDRATPTLRRYVDRLGRQIATSRRSLLDRERYSSDIPDSVYGLHTQAIVWQGLRGMSSLWRETGRPSLAKRCAGLATRLERGLRVAVRRSERRLADGSLFLDVRLLDRIRPYPSVTSSRLGSYWNLVMPYALGSGLFAPGSPETRGIFRYMQRHGSRLLGLVRSGAFSLYGRAPAYPESGVNPVYGLNVARFLADEDEPDQLVLSLYGYLAAAMTRGTFVSGEAVSVAPVGGERHRSTYLPPNAASNASYLETLRLALVHETRDRRGLPTGLELAYATPRAWLEPGKRILVREVPTSFGAVSFDLRSEADRVRISLDVPSGRRPGSLGLRLRLPPGARLGRVSVVGRAARRSEVAGETLDLSGLAGRVELVVTVERV